MMFLDTCVVWTLNSVILCIIVIYCYCCLLFLLYLYIMICAYNIIIDPIIQFTSNDFLYSSVGASLS